MLRTRHGGTHHVASDYRFVDTRKQASIEHEYGYQYEYEHEHEYENETALSSTYGKER